MLKNVSFVREPIDDIVSHGLTDLHTLNLNFIRHGNNLVQLFVKGLHR